MTHEQQEQLLSQITESRVLDYATVFYIANKLTRPIRRTKAYDLGLVDRDGKKIRDPETREEKNAYTLLDRLVFRIKQHLPLVTLTAIAAFIFLREEVEQHSPANLSEEEQIAFYERQEEAKDLYREFRGKMKSHGFSREEFWNLLLQQSLTQETLDEMSSEPVDVASVGSRIRLTQPVSEGEQGTKGTVVNTFSVGKERIVAVILEGQDEEVYLTDEMYEVAG